MFMYVYSLVNTIHAARADGFPDTSSDCKHYHHVVSFVCTLQTTTRMQHP